MPLAAGQPPTADLPEAGWPPRRWVGCVESAPHSGTSHSHWALQPLPWEPAASCAWHKDLVPQGLCLSSRAPGRQAQSTCLRRLPKAEIASRDLLIPCNLALGAAILSQCAWSHVLKGNCILNHCSSNHPFRICFPQSYTQTLKLEVRRNRTKALNAQTRHETKGLTQSGAWVIFPYFFTLFSSYAEMESKQRDVMNLPFIWGISVKTSTAAAQPSTEGVVLPSPT